MWCVAELDEEYVARMEDVLAVYGKPLSAREPVVLHEVRPPVAMLPGRVARRDGEYQRCGTANVFCGVQPKAGRHFTKVTSDRSSPGFADYLLDSEFRLLVCRELLIQIQIEFEYTGLSSGPLQTAASDQGCGKKGK